MISSIQMAVENVPFNVKMIVKDLKKDEIIISQEMKDTFSSASVIKVPILMAVLHYVEHNQLSLEQQIPIDFVNCVDFSIITERQLKKCTLYELIIWMIITSDNSATNVLIDLIGMNNLNSYFKTIGLKQTSLNRKMMDFEQLKKGNDNVTSALDMANLFTAIYRQELLSEKYNDIAINILLRQRDHESLKRYIVDDVKLANKPGSLDHVEHDIGIMYHRVKDYLIGVFVTEHQNNDEAKKFIGTVSKEVYDYFNGKDGKYE